MQENKSTDPSPEAFN